MRTVSDNAGEMLFPGSSAGLFAPACVCACGFLLAVTALSSVSVRACDGDNGIPLKRCLSVVMARMRAVLYSVMMKRSWSWNTHGFFLGGIRSGRYGGKKEVFKRTDISYP